MGKTTHSTKSGCRQTDLRQLWSCKSRHKDPALPSSEPSSSAPELGRNGESNKSLKRKRSKDAPHSSSQPNDVTTAPLLCTRHNDDNGPRWENNISLPNGPMLILRSYIGGKKSSERKSTRVALASLPDWNENVTFRIFGKECCMRRRICQYSSGGKLSYSYSGLRNIVAPDFPAVLYTIKCQVEKLVCDHILEYYTKGGENTKLGKNLTIPSAFIELLESMKNNGTQTNEIFNYCLLNHYRNGEEYMSYHTDDETSLDPCAPIASISLGVTRNFDIRLRKSSNISTGSDCKGTEKRSRQARIPLGDGDLLLMFPPMQSHYEHAVPVEKRVAGERINLTFRRIGTEGAGKS